MQPSHLQFLQVHFLQVPFLHESHLQVQDLFSCNFCSFKFTNSEKDIKFSETLSGKPFMLPVAKSLRLFKLMESATCLIFSDEHTLSFLQR